MVGCCFFFPESWRSGEGVGVVTPLPTSAAVGPPVPVLRVPCLGPVPVGVKVTVIRQPWSCGKAPADSVGGQLLVWA